LPIFFNCWFGMRFFLSWSNTFIYSLFLLIKGPFSRFWVFTWFYWNQDFNIFWKCTLSWFPVYTFRNISDGYSASFTIFDRSLSFLTMEVETPFNYVLYFSLEEDGAGWLLNVYGSKQLFKMPCCYLLLNT
jgi:hypothetical protein